MVGYTEALTDPSFHGQILVFTYPLIGNYGVPTFSKKKSLVPDRGFESHRIQVAGVVFSEVAEEPSHWMSQSALGSWLKSEGIAGITGIDTRLLAKLIRSTKGIRATIGDAIGDAPRESQNLLDSVSIREPMILGNGRKQVAVIDCGIKWNIVRSLLALDCTISLLPWNWAIEPQKYDGILISNGPGDPKATEDLVGRIRNFLSVKKPMFGICLGNQILALAAGADTEKMEYGHRGINQPVYDVVSEKGYITTQNHGYVIKEGTLPKDWEPWFVNANDGSIEGIRCKSGPFFGIQFHPEAAPGPHDTSWLLADFVSKL
jgi:carbamoyl-phosphate synthase small subunit